MTPRLLLFAALWLPAAGGAEITLLANGDTGDWQYQTFDGVKETSYRVADDAELGRVLIADSEQGASGYILRRELDLRDTPWLHFVWRVDAADDNPAEKTRAGDDFVWRLYFTGRSGIRYRTLNFVYAQTAAAGESWESPYSQYISDIRAVALAADADFGAWRSSAVNAAQLWESFFGDDTTIGLVGLMTDGDSAALNMRAAYGLLVLSDSPTPPLQLPPARP